MSGVKMPYARYGAFVINICIGLSNDHPPDKTNAMDWLVLLYSIVSVIALMTIAIFFMTPYSTRHVKEIAWKWAVVLMTAGAAMHVLGTFVTNAHMTSVGWMSAIQMFYCPFWSVWVKYLGFVLWFVGFSVCVIRWTIATERYQFAQYESVDDLYGDYFLESGDNEYVLDSHRQAHTKGQSEFQSGILQTVRNSEETQRTVIDLHGSSNDKKTMVYDTDPLHQKRVTNRAIVKYALVTLILLGAIALCIITSALKLVYKNGDSNVCEASIWIKLPIMLYLTLCVVYLALIIYDLRISVPHDATNIKYVARLVTRFLLLGVIMLCLRVALNVSGLTVNWWARAIDTCMLVSFYLMVILPFIVGVVLRETLAETLFSIVDALMHKTPRVLHCLCIAPLWIRKQFFPHLMPLDMKAAAYHSSSTTMTTELQEQQIDAGTESDQRPTSGTECNASAKHNTSEALGPVFSKSDAAQNESVDEVLSWCIECIYAIDKHRLDSASNSTIYNKMFALVKLRKAILPSFLERWKISRLRSIIYTAMARAVESTSFSIAKLESDSDNPLTLPLDPFRATQYISFMQCIAMSEPQGGAILLVGERRALQLFGIYDLPWEGTNATAISRVTTNSHARSKSLVQSRFVVLDEEDEIEDDTQQNMTMSNNTNANNASLDLCNEEDETPRPSMFEPSQGSPYVNHAGLDINVVAVIDTKAVTSMLETALRIIQLSARRRSRQVGESFMSLVAIHFSDCDAATINYGTYQFNNGYAISHTIPLQCKSLLNMWNLCNRMQPNGDGSRQEPPTQETVGEINAVCKNLILFATVYLFDRVYWTVIHNDNQNNEECQAYANDVYNQTDQNVRAFDA